MGINESSKSPTPEEVSAHYASGYERERLSRGSGKLEQARTCELLQRLLPPPPARVLDVGGGPGSYACHLATHGYEVHLAKQDLANGQHRNPTGNPEYFTDTFFHHPDELRDEAVTAGFQVSGVYGVEGPSWLVHDFDAWWDDSELQKRLLGIARDVETEIALIGISAHIMVAARK